jgi:hypothetical protein
MPDPLRESLEKPQALRATHNPGSLTLEGCKNALVPGSMNNFRLTKDEEDDITQESSSA